MAWIYRLRLGPLVAIIWAVAVTSIVLAYRPMAVSIQVNRVHKNDREPIHYRKPKIVARVSPIAPPEFALPGRYVELHKPTTNMTSRGDFGGFHRHRRHHH